MKIYNEMYQVSVKGSSRGVVFHNTYNVLADGATEAIEKAVDWMNKKNSILDAKVENLNITDMENILV